MKRVAVLTVVASLGAGCLPARAQLDSRDGIALQNQIQELRREVQTLRDQVSRGGGSSSSGGSFLGFGGGSKPPPQGAAPNDMTASLLDRTAALEDEVRRLRGRQDELANTEQRHYDDLSKQIGDLAFKVQGAGIPGAGPPATGPAPLVSPPPGNLGTIPAQPPLQPGIPVRRTPELALQEGNAALSRRDYAASEAAARDVLANNRTSPRAYDAQFLLAQSLEGKRDYPQAAIAYDDAYNRSRTGAHAPDALIGLANALGAINERKAACDTLNKLQAEFPRRTDLRPVADAARQRSGCR